MTKIQRQGLNQSIRRDAADMKTILASLKAGLDEGVVCLTSQADGAKEETGANMKQILNMALDDIQDISDFLENIEASAMALFEVEQSEA